MNAQKYLAQANRHIAELTVQMARDAPVVKREAEENWGNNECGAQKALETAL
jgi:hypothetical protein